MHRFTHKQQTSPLPEENHTRKNKSILTNYVKLVCVIDAAILVFNHTGIVSLVRGHYGLHDNGPYMVSNLDRGAEKQYCSVSL